MQIRPKGRPAVRPSLNPNLPFSRARSRRSSTAGWLFVKFTYKRWDEARSVLLPTCRIATVQRPGSRHTRAQHFNRAIFWVPGFCKAIRCTGLVRDPAIASENFNGAKRYSRARAISIASDFEMPSIISVEHLPPRRALFAEQLGFQRHNFPRQRYGKLRPARPRRSTLF